MPSKQLSHLDHYRRVLNQQPNTFTPQPLSSRLEEYRRAFDRARSFEDDDVYLPQSDIYVPPPLSTMGAPNTATKKAHQFNAEAQSWEAASQRRAQEEAPDAPPSRAPSRLPQFLQVRVHSEERVQSRQQYEHEMHLQIQQQIQAHNLYFMQSQPQQYQQAQQAYQATPRYNPMMPQFPPIAEPEPIYKQFEQTNPELAASLKANHDRLKDQAQDIGFSVIRHTKALMDRRQDRADQDEAVVYGRDFPPLPSSAVKEKGKETVVGEKGSD